MSPINPNLLNMSAQDMAQFVSLRRQLRRQTQMQTKKKVIAKPSVDKLAKDLGVDKTKIMEALNEKLA